MNERYSSVTIPGRSETADYLDIAMHRLRLLLGRRILWLRRVWRDDSLSDYRGLVISDSRADRLLAGNDREAEREFYQQDPGAVELTRSIEDTQERMASRGQYTQPSALQELTARFELSDCERDMLTLCLAPEVEPDLGRLYAYCQDDANRQYATGRLADSLFGLIHGEDAADILTPDGTLRRYRLITVADGCTAATPLIERSLQLDERVRSLPRVAPPPERLPEPDTEFRAPPVPVGADAGVPRELPRPVLPGFRVQRVVPGVGRVVRLRGVLDVLHRLLRMRVWLPRHEPGGVRDAGLLSDVRVEVARRERLRVDALEPQPLGLEDAREEVGHATSPPEARPSTRS